MGKKMQKSLMPMNLGDVGFVVFHLGAELALAVATALDNVAQFSAINSNHIDNRKREKAERREFESAVRNDLERMDVKGDG